MAKKMKTMEKIIKDLRAENNSLRQKVAAWELLKKEFTEKAEAIEGSKRTPLRPRSVRSSRDTTPSPTTSKRRRSVSKKRNMTTHKKPKTGSDKDTDPDITEIPASQDRPATPAPKEAEERETEEEEDKTEDEPQPTTSKGGKEPKTKRKNTNDPEFVKIQQQLKELMLQHMTNYEDLVPRALFYDPNTATLPLEEKEPNPSLFGHQKWTRKNVPPIQTIPIPAITDLETKCAEASTAGTTFTTTIVSYPS